MLQLPALKHWERISFQPLPNPQKRGRSRRGQVGSEQKAAQDFVLFSSSTIGGKKNTADSRTKQTEHTRAKSAHI